MRHHRSIQYAALSKRDRVFLECGCCGQHHHRDLPGHVDCRDDAHRFSTTQLDAMFSEDEWTWLTLEDQARDEIAEMNS